MCVWLRVGVFFVANLKLSHSLVVNEDRLCKSQSFSCIFPFIILALSDFLSLTCIFHILNVMLPDIVHMLHSDIQYVLILTIHSPFFCPLF